MLLPLNSTDQLLRHRRIKKI